MSKRCVWMVGVALACCAAPVSAGAKALTIGEKGAEVKGEVKDSDPKVTFRFMDVMQDMPAKEFTVKLEAGKSYTFALDTDAEKFDPFLIIQDKDGKQVAFDDDGGGRLNSLIKDFSPPGGGTFKVFAASLNGDSGPFALKVTVAGGAAKGKTLKVGAGGVRIADALAAANLRMVYDLEFEAGKTYVIDLKSGDFDAFLILEKDGKLLASNDDVAAGNLDSQIVFRADAAGVYRVIATSLSKRETGKYSFEVQMK